MGRIEEIIPLAPRGLPASSRKATATFHKLVMHDTTHPCSGTGTGTGNGGGPTGKKKISRLENIAKYIDEAESSDQRYNSEKEKPSSTRVFPLDTFHVRQPQVQTLGGRDKNKIEKLTVKRS